MVVAPPYVPSDATGTTRATAATLNDHLHRALVRAATHHPEQPFVIEAETGYVMTYGQCLAAVNDLRRMIGTPPKRIALVLPGGITGAVLWLGALTGGHLLVPLASDAAETEKARATRLYTPDLLIVEDDDAARGFDCATATVITQQICDEAIQQARSGGPPVSPMPGRVALSTSGTTGEPKGVILEGSQIAWTAEQIRLSHRLTPRDRGLTVLPFSHVNAPVVSLCASLLTGSTIVIARRFSRERFWDWVERYQVTWASIVPTVLTRLLDTPKPGFLPGALRFVRTASAPLPAARMRAFEGTFGIPVIETYGLTEAASTIVANPVPPGRHKPGSVGLPIGVDLRVCHARSDERGCSLQEVAPGEQGEICVRGPGVIPAYRGGVGHESFEAGWFRTGDLGYRDEEGYLYITGRLRDMINRGGEKIAPREVEEVLLTHPAVRDAAVIGRPDAQYGEVAVAYVVADEAWSRDDLVQCLHHYAAARLSAYKVPVDFVRVEALPRNPNGKINREALRTQEARRDRRS
ncbi:MAG: AMP-binding protein [Thermomicrobiales bacterium]